MNNKDIRKWINIIRTDINMMAGNIYNKDRFEEMRNNALTNLSYLEQNLTSD